jgi:lipopolysaccharide cholinephosphotransferase
MGIDLKKINQYLFYAVILLVRLPNFYIFPIQSSFFLSNNLLRVITILIVVLNLYIVLKEKRKIYSYKKLLLVVGVFFISQSLSIINAQNIQAFLSAYKDMIFGLLLYMSGCFILDSKNIKRYTLFLQRTILFALVVQVAVLIIPIFQNFYSSILNEAYLSFFDYQLSRGRYFGGTLEEAYIPILLLDVYILTSSLQKKIISTVSTTLAIYISYISNWRTKFIICIFSLFCSLVLNIKRMYIYILILIVFTFSLFLLINRSFPLDINQTSIDRLLSDSKDERQINTSRLNYLSTAYTMGRANLITGVGLGNYYDSLTLKEKDSLKSTGYGSERFILIDDPHNIFFSVFATSGLLGLFSLILLLGFFLKKDISVVLSPLSHSYSKAYICVFWGIFIYACFNPWVNVEYLRNFWLVRAFVDSTSILKSTSLHI